MTASLIRSGSGGVTIDGANADGTSDGVDASGTIDATGGAISITGFGGPNDGEGVRLDGMTLGSANTTGITLNGTASPAGSGDEDGVLIVSSTIGASGPLTITGVAADTGKAVELDAVNVTVSGDISVNGTGVAAAGVDFNTGTSVTSTSGNITISGRSGTDLSVEFIDATVLNAATGVTIAGDKLDLVGSATTIEGGGPLVIESESAAFNSSLTTQGITFGTTFSSARIGKTTNTENVTIGTAGLNVAGPVEIYGGTTTLDGDVVSTAGTATLLVNGSTAIVLNGGNLATNDGGITLDGNVTLAAAATIDSGSGAGDVLFKAVVDGNHALTVAAGTGNVTFDAAVGGQTPVGSVDVSGDTLSLANTTTAGAQAFSGSSILPAASHVTAGGTVTLNGAVTLNDPVTIDTTDGGNVTSGGNVSLLGAIDSQTGEANSLNITAGSAGVVSLDGSLGASMPLGAVTITADRLELAAGAVSTLISTTDQPINVAATITDGSADTTLLLNAGTGAITIDSVANVATIDVLSSAGTTFTGEVEAGIVEITNTTGTVAFNSNITLGDLLTTANGYDVSITGSKNLVTNATSFLNTGNVTLGDSTGDETTFAGGLNTTAGPAVTKLAGTVLTSNTAMDLGAVVISGGNATLGSGSGTIDIASATTGLSALVLKFGTPGQTGAVTVAGNLDVAYLQTAAENFSVSLLGPTVVDSAVSFTNTGGVTLGDGAADTLNFAGGVTSTDSTTTVFGTVLTDGTAITFGNVTLGGNSTFDTGSGVGDINIASVSGAGHSLAFDADGGTVLASGGVSDVGTLTITQSAGATFQGAVSAATIDILGTTANKTVAFEGDLNVTGSFDTLAGGYNVYIIGTTNSIAGPTTFANTGTVRLGDQAGDSVTHTGAIDTTAAAVTELGGTLESTNANITLGDTTLIDSGAVKSGSGLITFASLTDDAQSYALTIGSIAQSGAVSVLGNATIATLSTATGTYDLSLLGTNTTIDTATSFTNGGTLTLGGVGDTLTFVDGLDSTGGPTLTRIGGTIQTTDSGLFLGSTQLLANTTLGSGSGSLEIADATDGASAFTLGLGTAGQTGTTTILGNLTVDAIQTVSSAYGISLLGTTTTVTQAATFTNTGSVTLGNSVTDVMTFTGGVNTTAASATNLAGSLKATDTAVVLGATTLTAASSITTGSGPITLASVTDGASSFALQLGNVGQTGAATITGNATIATVVTAGGTYAVSLLGTTTTIDTSTSFLNRGTVTLGGAGDTVTFTGGLSTTAGPSGTNVGGTILTTNKAMSLGNTTLQADTSFGSGSGIITIASLAEAGGFVAGLGTAGQSGAVTVTGNVAISGFTTVAATYDVSLLGTATQFTNASIPATFSNEGGLTLGGTGDTVTFASALTATAPSAVNIAGTITATNQNITFGNTALTGNASLASGSGVIVTDDVTDGAGNHTLSLGNPTQTGAVSLEGNVTLDGLATGAGAFGFSLLGAVNTFTTPVTLLNNLAVTLGDELTDNTLFTGGLNIADVSNQTFLIGTIRSAGAEIALDLVSLMGNATIDTTDAGANPAGATVTLEDQLLLNGFTLTTEGGTNSSTDITGMATIDFGRLFVETGDLKLGDGPDPGNITVTGNTSIEVANGSLGVSNGSVINAGTNTLVLKSDGIFIESGNGSITAGDITLAPYTAGTDVFLGTASGAGVVLNQTALDALNAAIVTIGEAGNNGTVTIGATALAVPRLDIIANGTGGRVIQAGNFISTASGTPDGIGLQVFGSGSTYVLGADITSATAVIILDAVEVEGGSRTIDTSGGNATINITGGSAGIFATNGETTNSLVINAGSGNVTLGTSAGFGNANGSDEFVADLTINAGSTVFGTLPQQVNGTLTIATGQVAFGGDFTAGNAIAITTTSAMTLTGNATLSAGSDIDIAADIEGGFDLALASTGNTALAGLVGDTVRLGSLSVTAGGTMNLAGGSINTTGAQTYNGVVLLGASTVLNSSATGNIDFVSTLDGAHALEVQTAGVTTFSGAVGNATALASLTTDAGGLTVLGATSVETTGNQTYADPVTLSGSTTLSGDEIGLEAVIGGGFDLTIAGNTSLAGQVSNVANLDVTGTTLVSANVSTTGNQSYGGLVTLNAATVQLSGDTGTFATGVAGNTKNLILDFSGTTLITGADFIGLNDLTTGNNGTTQLSGSITTSGNQTYNDQVELVGPATLDAGSANITFASGLDGNTTLDLLTTGAITFDGEVGNTTPLDSINTSAGSTANIATTLVTTTGAQQYAGSLTLAEGTTLTASVVTNNGTITGNGKSLAISGDALVAGAIQGVADYQVSGNATLASNVTTSGTQLYSGPLALSGGDVILNGSTITAASTVDGGGNGLEIIGDAILQDAVGNVTNLSVSGTSSLGANVSTSGTQVYGGAVTLTSNVTLNGSTVTTSAAILGGSHALTVVGDAVVGGDVSLVTDYTVTGNATINAASVTSSGVQNYTGLVTLGSPAVTLTGTTPTFGGGVAGANNSLILNFSGTTAIDGDQFTGLNALTTGNGGATQLTGNLTTSGNQTYNDAVTLAGNTTLTGPAVTTATTVSGGGYSLAVSGAANVKGAITGLLDYTVNGTATLEANVGGTGVQTYLGPVVLQSGDRTLTAAIVNLTDTVTASGGSLGIVGNVAIGGTVSGINNLQVSGATSLGGDVSGTGTQTFTGAVTLADNVSLTGSTIRNDGAISGAGYDLSVTGNATVNAPISGVDDYSVSGTAAVNTGSITTTGNQSYGGLVSLGMANVTLTGATPTFSTGVNGANNSVTLNFTGTTAIDGATFTNITALTSTGGGLTTLTGALTTMGAQTFGDNVSLVGGTTLAAGSSDISFAGTVDGGQSLALNSTGTVTLGLAVGGSTPLSSIVTDAGGALLMNGGNVTTTGTQTYNDNITLGADTVLAGSLVRNNGLVSGNGQSLAVSGDGTISGAVSNVTTFSVSGASTISADVSATVSQTYTGPATLDGSDRLLTAPNVTFDNTLTGGTNSLTVAGNLALENSVVSMANLNVTGGTAINAASVTTSGTQVYGGLVTLVASNVTLVGTTPTFTTGVEGAGNNLTLDFSGTTAIVGEQFTNLADLTTDGGGTTQLSGNLTTTGNQTFNDAVTLSGNSVLTGREGAFATGVTGAGFDLVLNYSEVTALDAAFAGVGNLTSYGPVALNGSISTTGTQSYQNTASLSGNTTLSGRDAAFAQGLEGMGNSLVLNMTDTTLISAGFANLTDLTSEGNVSLNGTVTTSGAQTYNGTATLAGNTTLIGDSLSLAQGLDGASHSVVLNFAQTTSLGGA